MPRRWQRDPGPIACSAIRPGSSSDSANGGGTGRGSRDLLRIRRELLVLLSVERRSNSSARSEVHHPAPMQHAGSGVQSAVTNPPGRASGVTCDGLSRIVEVKQVEPEYHRENCRRI